MNKSFALLLVTMLLLGIGGFPGLEASFVEALSLKTLWAKSYGGSEFDQAYSVATAPNGDIIVVGNSYSFGAGNRDAWILRLSPEGDVKWEKTYGGSDYDTVLDVALTPEGHIVAVGYTSSFGNEGSWVFCLDGNGNIKWQKVYAADHQNFANSLAIFPEGDILIGGSIGIPTTNFGGFARAGMLLRLSPSGDMKWAREYVLGDTSSIEGVAVSKKGDIFSVGYGVNLTKLTWDAVLLRLDESGNVKWARYYGGKVMGSNAVANDVIVPSEGSVIVGGVASTFGAGKLDYWVLYLDETGELLPEGIRNQNFTSFEVKPMVENVDMRTIDSSASVMESEASVKILNLEPLETNSEVEAQYYLVLESQSKSSESQKEGSSLVQYLSLSYLWTTWFLDYHSELSEFCGTFTNSTASSDNETLTLVCGLDEKATSYLLEGWEVTSLSEVESLLWWFEGFDRLSKLWLIRKAFLLEREAFELMKKYLEAS